MTSDDVREIVKPAAGLGVACEAAAKAIEDAGDKFQPPPGVTPEGLRLAGRRAEGADGVLLDLAVVTELAKQSNYLFDAEAYRLLSRVNDQVKSQGKDHPDLRTMFAAVSAYFARPRRHTAAPVVTTTPTGTAPTGTTTTAAPATPATPAAGTTPTR
jgi:hypothetical protein